MGYLSLYRKWRPKTFDDLAGQTAVVKTLKNALMNNRIAHAYLFCGPRGTGKTSMAKVFAKALNCEQGPTIEPCNECFSCQQINSGRSVDVIEIDAASNRGVNEIRDLRDKVRYSPSEGDYKVYIIDEVHMLTKEAFNALLKTLEEPPENVVFILATTEPHKVIPTVQSRCQRFDFGLLSIREIEARLKYICEQESISANGSVLTLIARTAEGGMRDAISILDQAIAFGGDKVTVSDVITILGKVEHQVLAELVKAIARHDTKSGLKLINEIADQGKDLNQFVKDLLFHFRDLMLIKECGLQNTIFDLPEELKEELVEEAGKFTITDLLRIMEILSEIDQGLKYASQPRLLLEMGIVKLTSEEADISFTNIITRLARVEELVQNGSLNTTMSNAIRESGTRNNGISRSKKSNTSVNTVSMDELKDKTNQGKELQTVVESSRELLSDSGSSQDDNSGDITGSIDNIFEENIDVNISMEEMDKYWESTMNLLKEVNQTRKLRAFLLHGKPLTIIGNTLYIVFPEYSTFHKTHAEKEINLLERVLKKVTGQNLKATCIFEGEEPKIPDQSRNPDSSEDIKYDLDIRPKQTLDNLENDPLVKKALHTFGGKVIRVEVEKE